MKNWSLSGKIWSVVGILSFAFIVSSAFSIEGLLEGRSMLNEITQVLVKRDQAVEEINDNQRRIFSLAMEMILKTDEATLKKLSKDYVQLTKKMDDDVKAYSLIASPEGKVLLEKYLSTFDTFFDAVKTAQGLALEGKKAEATEVIFSVDDERKQMRGILADLDKLAKTRVDLLSTKANEKALLTITISLVISLGSIVASLLIAFYTLRALTQSISTIVRSLSDSSIQVSGAASQIASSAEELSRATTEQAASLEETAASVEELNSMVARNSENARSAEETSGHSQHAVAQGNDVIRKMMESMEAINRSSEGMAETVKVIEQIDRKTKVINEIVNKTELLSFNASVEAARAGEHGKGFAVVAEEVGNLARMSGAAAEEIATLLEESISKVNQMVQDTKRNVENGTQVARDCGGVFETIVQNVSSVSGMAKEIASASNEQARGCGEITKAMTQLDQMTQQNAATSEECAASAEELSAQAEALKGAVAHLVRTINGQPKTDQTSPDSVYLGHIAPTAPMRATNLAPQLQSSHQGIAYSGQPMMQQSGSSVVQLRAPRQGMGPANQISTKAAANGAPAYNSDGFKDV